MLKSVQRTTEGKGKSIILSSYGARHHIVSISCAWVSSDSHSPTPMAINCHFNQQWMAGNTKCTWRMPDDNVDNIAHSSNSHCGWKSPFSFFWSNHANRQLEIWFLLSPANLICYGTAAAQIAHPHSKLFPSTKAAAACKHWKSYNFLSPCLLLILTFEIKFEDKIFPFSSVKEIWGRLSQSRSEMKTANPREEEKNRLKECSRLWGSSRCEA